MTSAIIPFRPRPFDLNRVFQSENQRYSLGPNWARRRLNNNTDQIMARRSYRRPRVARARGRRVGRGRTRTLYKRNYSTNGAGILGGTNADTRQIYRRTSMPRRKRRQWASFIKKVNAVDERELGTRTVLFNDSLQQSNVAVGKQSCLTLALYPFVNTNRGWLNDMSEIGQLENEGNPSLAAGATIDKNTKVMFHSAVMDVTLRNTSTKYGAEGAIEIAPEAAIELDVYDIIMRSEAADGSQKFFDISACLNAYDDREIGGAGTGIEIADRGSTPFELPSGLSRFKIKVLKKTKYFIPNGQTITFQVRNPKRKVIRYGELETNDSHNRPGWTTYKYMIYKLVPGLAQGTAQGEYKLQLSVGSTRKYMYKVEGFNEPRERLLGGSYTPNSQQ